MSTDPVTMPDYQVQDLERIRSLMNFGTVNEVIIFINEAFIQVTFQYTVYRFEELERMDREDFVYWINKSLVAILKSEEQPSPQDDSYHMNFSTPDSSSITPGSSTPTSPSISILTPDSPSVSTPDRPRILTPDSPSISTSHSPRISTPNSPSMEAPYSDAHDVFASFINLTFEQAEEFYQLPPGTTMIKWTVQMRYVLLYLARYQLGLPDST